MKVYFDNAATTRLDEEVFEEMIPYLKQHYGNPSSAHQHGRDARLAIENSRMTIATLLNVLPNQIVFTSGGTEADNTAIFSAVKGRSIKHIITSKLEHHAVLNAVHALQKREAVRVSYVQHDAFGNLDLEHLETLFANNPTSLVSIMHGNNEVGNLNDIAQIGAICKQHGAVFHSDTVQTIGHHQLDLSRLSVDFIVGSAHKFHGPKGVGFLFVRNPAELQPHILGGSQEKRLRAGTENVAGIVGLAKALNVAWSNLEEHNRYIANIKRCCIERLKSLDDKVRFNGNSALAGKSLDSVLSVGLSGCSADILSKLDSIGISASGGSACNSQSHSSHVLDALNTDPFSQNIRLSFSRFNTLQEVDLFIDALASTYSHQQVA